MPDEKVELLVGGQVYAGWEGVGVTRAMDGCAGAFFLEVADRWSAKAKPWEIQPGDVCEVRLGGETVITGYVDMARPRFGPESHSIEVQGRDATADLIDCSAVHDPDEWKRIDFLELANILGAPFGVAATAEVDVGPSFELVKLDQGETALEALARYGKMRRLLVMPDAKGGLLITRAGTGTAEVELVQGVNIIDASGTLDWSERFSDYIVKGQANYGEESDPEAEAHVLGTAKDAYLTRYRPLLITAETDANPLTAQERAAWEAVTRLGMSTQAEITVQGWRQTEGGALWEPNLLVRVRSPWLRMDGEMLIRAVNFGKGSGGTFTTLSLVSPLAFEPEPPDGSQKKKPKEGGKSSKNPWLTTISESVRNA